MRCKFQNHIFVRQLAFVGQISLILLIIFKIAVKYSILLVYNINISLLYSPKCLKEVPIIFIKITFNTHLLELDIPIPIGHLPVLDRWCDAIHRRFLFLLRCKRLSFYRVVLYNYTRIKIIQL